MPRWIWSTIRNFSRTTHLQADLGSLAPRVSNVISSLSPTQTSPPSSAGSNSMSVAESQRCLRWWCLAARVAERFFSFSEKPPPPLPSPVHAGRRIDKTKIHHQSWSLGSECSKPQVRRLWTGWDLVFCFRPRGSEHRPRDLHGIIED